MAREIKNIVVISDTHFGSTLALSMRHQLDDGGYYDPSVIQKKLFAYWQDFWEWIYQHLDGEPFVLVHNGDIIDGVHHRTTTLSSHNLTIQNRLAVEMMEPHVANAKAYYQIRGTEAHVGQSAQDEEAVAAVLGAVQDEETGQYSRWEMWMEFGEELIHFSHHIGTTNSTAYESSGPMREIVAAFVESGQWKGNPPTIIVRSHRHRYIKVSPPNSCIVVTPAWQAKTPFVFKIDRMRGPMFGGLLIRKGKDGVVIKEKIYTLARGEPVKI